MKRVRKQIEKIKNRFQIDSREESNKPVILGTPEYEQDRFVISARRCKMKIVTARFGL